MSVVEANERLEQMLGPVSGATSQRELHNAAGRMGTLLVAGEIPPLAMDSLSSLVSLTLDRHQAFVKEGISNAARETEQLRTAVLDGLAHAFKTPLTIIRAASTGLLEIGPLDDLQDELAKMIDVQSSRLDELANELLQTARVDAEKVCLSMEPISVCALVEKVVAEVRRERVGLDSCPPSIAVQPVPPALHFTADYRMIAGTLKELLQNAVKYSTPGTQIDVSTTETETEIVIAVRNHGALIQAEERERIFERFYRGAGHSDSAPGTGIGLSVARGVTEAHGGQIWVVSNEVDGTTFHLSLPKDGMARRV
jgi:two-component system sensor histidine kinase KdpD